MLDLQQQHKQYHVYSLFAYYPVLTIIFIRIKDVSMLHLYHSVRDNNYGAKLTDSFIS